MTEKKTQVITFRTEEWVKEELDKVAQHNKWSLAQTVNQILVNYLINPHPERITVKAEDFVKAAIEIRQEGLDKGVEISIDLVRSEENQKFEKYLTYNVIESGGLGCIPDFEPIKAMTQEEILNIP